MNNNTFLGIALSGKSGAGKSTLAEYLVKKYSFEHISSGSICRKVCRLLFDEESKMKMNAITAAMKNVQEDVWIAAAIKSCKFNRPVVLDSMRFWSDYKYCKNNSFYLLRIECEEKVRLNRLTLRGQEFNNEIDSFDSTEIELDNATFDMQIDNSENNDKMFESIDQLFRNIRFKGLK